MELVLIISNFICVALTLPIYLLIFFGLSKKFKVIKQNKKTRG